MYYLGIPAIIQQLGVGPGWQWHVVVTSEPQVVV